MGRSRRLRRLRRSRKSDESAVLPPGPSLPLLALPNELILLIAERLHFKDLYSLLRCSRHLSLLLEPLLRKSALAPKRGTPALLWAIKKNRFALLRYILENGVDIDINMLVPMDFREFTLSIGQRSILQWAISMSLRDWGVLDYGIIEVLLRKGAKVPQDFPLECDESVIELLLGYGAPMPLTPLHRIASMDQRLELERRFRVYIEMGADIEEKDCQGYTPLHIAAHRRQEELVEILLEYGADVTALDPQGYTPLHSTALNPHDHRTRPLYDIPLYWQFKKYQNRQGFLGRGLRIISLLLEHGADISARTSDYDITPLHFAAFSSTVEADVGLIEKLLENGADMAAVDIWGNTPLHYAAQAGSEDAVCLLLSSGADFTALGDNENTLLHMAAKELSITKVELLLDRGADISAVNMDGMTPLHLAVQGQRGSGISKTNNKYCGERGVGDVVNHEAVVTLLLERGAKIDAEDSEGKRPFYYAHVHGHIGIITLLSERESVIEELP